MLWPGQALGASGRVTVELEEHGGYVCAGCKKTWSSLRSLNHHRASPYMRGTECEEVKNSRELRNIFRANLATGQDSRLPLFSKGGGEILKENPMASTRANSHHQYVFQCPCSDYPFLITTYYIALENTS
jgi:hypothetical protein